MTLPRYQLKRSRMADANKRSPVPFKINGVVVGQAIRNFKDTAKESQFYWSGKIELELADGTTKCLEYNGAALTEDSTAHMVRTLQPKIDELADQLSDKYAAEQKTRKRKPDHETP